MAAENETGLDATVTLEYNDVEFNGVDETFLTLFLNTTGSFEALPSFPDYSANTVTSVGVDALGVFGLADETAVPEPATVTGSLAYGTCPEPPATLPAGRARCSLEVSGTNLLATAQRCTVFLVLGGTDGAAAGYSRRAFRREIKLGPGETATQPVKLLTTDADPLGTYAVTLLAEEGSVAAPSDAAVELATLTVEKAAGSGLRTEEPLAVFPSPAIGDATVRFAVPEAVEARASVYDVLGREVRHLVGGEVEDVVEARVAGLAPGLYLIRLATASGRTETVRFSVAR